MGNGATAHTKFVISLQNAHCQTRGKCVSSVNVDVST